MVQSSSGIDLQLAVFGGAFVMILLAGCVVWFMAVYQKRLLKQELNFKKMELRYQQELINSTIEGIESERKRLARDLHDEIGAALSAMRLLVGQIHTESLASSDIVSLTNKYKSLIDNTIDNVRRISNDLLPSGLEEFGLSYAIEGLCEHCMELTEAEIDWQVEDIKHNQPNLDLMIYRLVQELLNNTLKYAQASIIKLSIVAEQQEIVLKYEDNGIGFDYNEAYKKKSLGLKNLETRTRMFNGTISFVTATNKGVDVSVRIPL